MNTKYRTKKEGKMPMKVVDLHVLVDMIEKSRELCKRKRLQCDKKNENFTRTMFSMPKKKKKKKFHNRNLL